MARVNVPGLAASDGEIFKCRPAGQYPARISAVEVTETKMESKHPGSPMLKLTLKLGEYEGMAATQLFQYIILPNPDYMDAEQMRKKTAELKRICMAVGLECGDDFDTDELFDQQLLVVLSVEVQKDGPYAGKEQNRITDFLSL